MEAIFMNTKNTKASKPHRFKLDLTDKLYLKNPNKNMASANLSIYHSWKSSSQNTKTINLKFWHQLGMIILIENPPVQIYPNKIKNRIVFKIKTGYKLEFLIPETIKLLGSTKKDVYKDKDGEIVPKLESVEVLLVHCNLIKNDHQHTSKVLYSFVLNKKFRQLINISP